MTFRDSINTEIDRRKISTLVDNGVITQDEIDNASIVFLCSCGYEQDINNDTCENCGKSI